MRTSAWQDTSRANWIDYVLCWLSSALAVYSCGQAVATNNVSIIGIIGVTVGTGFSYLVRTVWSKKKFSNWDGYFYAVVAWVAILAARQLNVAVFPEDTFPPELTPSSWLLWMTILGSFFAWRDGTLIFQSIPALAIFGFVGCYDTFKAVVILFFVFILCFATLFARTHGREMQSRAVASGYFSVGRSLQMNPEEQSASLREGPWRWAAGAEWALGSALIIVVLSTIAAPLIQASARPLSGLVNLRPPRLRTAPATQQNATAVPTISKVGTGPVSLSDTPYFEVTGNIPEYLRIGIYNVWNGTGWSVSSLEGKDLRDRMTGNVQGIADEKAIEIFRFPNKKPNEFSDQYRSQALNIRALFATKEVPQAGNDPNFSGSNGTDASQNFITLSGANRYEARINYDKVPGIDSASKVPKVLDSHTYAHMSTSLVSEGVRLLTNETIAGISGDFDRANAIKDKISKLIKYNTSCRPTPDNKDPVQYALIESHEGYCDLFGSAMVQMARVAKIPARYVIGYLPDPKNLNSSGTQLLLESDRHVWAELYFENTGWVAFDATEGAEVVPGGGRKDNKPTDYNQIVRIVGIAINGLIVGAVLIGVALYIRIRRLPKTVLMIRSELDTEYVEFIGSIWKFTGQRRLLSETTHEYLARVGEQLGDLREQAHQIGVGFTNLMFGPQEIALTDLDETRESVQNFKGLLTKMQKSR